MSFYSPYDAWIHLFHIIFVSGLFFYIGSTQDKIPKYLYPIFIGLGVFIILYHIYKSIYKKDAWVNYLHIFIFGPLLIYIGWMEDKTQRKFFEMSLMLAFASFGYHLYFMVT